MLPPASGDTCAGVVLGFIYGFLYIGIIAIPDPDYDARHWWRYSEGVREILGESIAYLYAAWFFRPPPS